MQKEVKKSWALFLGIGTMMIAHGLQMQIMGIRSVLEQFSIFTTGHLGLSLTRVMYGLDNDPNAPILQKE